MLKRLKMKKVTILITLLLLIITLLSLLLTAQRTEDKVPQKVQNQIRALKKDWFRPSDSEQMTFTENLLIWRKYDEIDTFNYKVLPNDTLSFNGHKLRFSVTEDSLIFMGWGHLYVTAEHKKELEQIYETYPDLLLGEWFTITSSINRSFNFYDNGTVKVVRKNRTRYRSYKLTGNKLTIRRLSRYCKISGDSLIFQTYLGDIYVRPKEFKRLNQEYSTYPELIIGRWKNAPGFYATSKGIDVAKMFVYFREDDSVMVFTNGAMEVYNYELDKNELTIDRDIPVRINIENDTLFFPRRNEFLVRDNE